MSVLVRLPLPPHIDQRAGPDADQGLGCRDGPVPSGTPVGPLIRRSGKVPWTEPDNAWLRAHYATATKEELQARFPHRTYMAIRKQTAALGITRRQKGVPKPKGERWDEAENARLRAYAAGQLSYTELQAQLPGRTWDGIEHQACILGLTFQEKPVYHHLVPDAREMVSEEDPSTMV